VAVSESFADVIAKGYETSGPAIELGRGVHDGELAHEALVQVPLAMMNRHGLIAGATGTGKTRTLQGLAEQLSAAGVPVVVADIKGDLSGLAAPGATDGPAARRAADLGETFAATAFPVEFLSLGGIGPGVPVRATVTDFGPRLLAKVFGSNETQEQSLSLVFRYADERKLALLDLADLRAVLAFRESDEGKADLAGIGGVSPATIGVLLRALAVLEDGGGNEFLGEPQLDIADLMRTAGDGRGVISALELAAVQDKPQLFSTVLMWLVAELFEQLPEVGDLDKPKMVVFFDEAHLLFDDATDAFLQSVTQTVRLIRAKGVGVFVVTQSPTDVPADVLGQLGNRIQHALRAFTPDDAKALKATVSTYPRTDLYDLEQVLTQLAIGEAVVTILSDSGVPTPVVHTRLRAPQSQMTPIPDIDGAAKASPLFARYGTRVDAQSAREILAGRMAASSQAAAAPAPAAAPAKPAKAKAKPKKRAQSTKAQASAAGGALGTLGDLLGSSQGKAIQKEIARGVFGMLKKRL
jgi:DNA helicase HerA-like ATPase